MYRRAAGLTGLRRYRVTGLGKLMLQVEERIEVRSGLMPAPTPEEDAKRWATIGTWWRDARVEDLTEHEAPK